MGVADPTEPLEVSSPVSVGSQETSGPCQQRAGNPFNAVQRALSRLAADTRETGSEQEEQGEWQRNGTCSLPTWKRSLDDPRTCGLGVSRPSRGPETGHEASNSAADDRSPLSRRGFGSTPGGTRTPNLLIGRSPSRVHSRPHRPERRAFNSRFLEDLAAAFEEVRPTRKLPKADKRPSTG